MFLFMVVLWFVQAQPRHLEARVLDSQGLPVAGAQITVTERPGGGSRTATSTLDAARFDGLAAAVYDVRVEADGFGPQTLTADLRNTASSVLEVRLELERLSQEVIVAATRTEQRLGEVPASATVLRGDVIKESPAVVADDVLRQAPTFSLFRRASSLAAHPTAQGVSLRGVGPSGVSRTLVLLDNIPFNDPFGGWVYWTRVPLISVDRIEMVDGANSSVYGNYAMGGVINIVTVPPTRRTFVLRPQYGWNTRKLVPGAGEKVSSSPKFDFFASDVWGPVGVAAEGSIFDTDGFPAVVAGERGRVDTKATVNYQNLNLKIDYTGSDRLKAFVRGGYFSEDRLNAKICAGIPVSCQEANDTLWKYISGGVRARTPGDGDLQARIFVNFETFHSNFLAVPAANPPRSIGRLTLLQKVPTKDVGLMAQWSKPFASRHYFTAGADWRRVDGDSLEDALDAVTGTTVTLKRVSGGTQQSVGVFLQDVISATSRLQLTLSTRFDYWRNYDAKNLETTVATGQPAAGNRLFPDKDSAVASPHAGALYHVTDAVRVFGRVSWAFRAPSLNELYRQFRVGAVLTLANDQLGPERLVSGESGVNVEPVRNLTWRTTWFINRVTNPVSNVTQTVVGANITRQRQNLGRTKIWGIQSDVEYRLRSAWRFSAGYLYDMATVREFNADRSLIGRFLPQVPKHRGSAQIAYSNPKYISVAAQAQFVSRQFDDDQNLLRLGGFGLVDLSANRTISRNLEAFFGVQNLFDREFLVQRNPSTLGVPRMMTAGVKISFMGR